MRNRFIIQFLFLIFLGAGIAFAGPGKQDQESFTQQYQEMKAKGGQEYQDWSQDIYQKGSQDDAQMLGNLEQGKTADGRKKTAKELEADQKNMEETRKKQGFMGDPTDSGPADWSNYDIQKDKDGNVNGFKEKDFEQKDKDGDGKISKEERDAWNKKKAEEDKKNGGPPGQVHKAPDWDKNEDGIPDPGFTLQCYRCFQNPSNAGQEDCKDNSCNMDECSKHGYTSDPKCNEQCSEFACKEFTIDKESGQSKGNNSTREKGSTIQCYKCIIPDETESKKDDDDKGKKDKKKDVTDEYFVLVIESPFERYILGGSSGPQGFVPSQVMALTRINPLVGMLPGMDLSSIASLMQQGLNKGNRYDKDCFSKDFQQADFSKAAQPPASSDDSKSSGNFGSDPSLGLSTGGPVVACGQNNGEKALMVMDASGRTADMITKDKLKKDPQAVQEAMSKAQQASDAFISIRQQGFENFLKQKAQSLVEGFVQKMQQKVLHKAQENFKNKKVDKSQKNKKIVPDDPYYAIKAAKEKKLLSILPVPSLLSGIIGGGGNSGGVSVGMRGKSSSLNMGTSQEEEKEKISYQWGLHAIGFTPMDDPNSAWNFVDFNKKNMIVAVIDSGLDMEHPDSPQYIWTNDKEIPGNGIDDDGNGYVDDVHGWNFLDGSNDLTDLQGHGSFVAGIIAAKWNNGLGIAGINPGAVIMPLKVADAKGRANSFNIFRAVHYAVEHGARVINISLGARGISALEREAMAYANAMGVFVCVASGNGGESITGFGPSSMSGAFAVGALDIEGTRSMVSNYGPNNGLLAPGDQIISLIAKGTGYGLRKSLIKQGYYPQSGTSFSSPMVAATVSLLLVQNSHLTPQDIEDILYRSADSIDDKSWDDKTGAGLLNASAALQHIAQRSVTVKIDETRLNMTDKKLSSVDVFATVRGEIASYVLELGKGRHAKDFVQAAGPYSAEANHNWIAHIQRDQLLRGSNEWILRIRVTDKQGHESIAQMTLEFK